MAKFKIGQRLTHRNKDSRNHIWVILDIDSSDNSYTLQKITPDPGRPFDYSIDDVERQLILNSNIRRP